MPKILFIGFGIPPFTPGGAVYYQHGLMEELVEKGWKVSAFLASPRYTLRNKPCIKIWTRNNIKFIEFFNTPYIPEHQNNPELQCSNPFIEKLTSYILAEEKPDIVHIHELQFHPVSIIDIIMKLKIPVIKTIHNYYDICPQRDLMYQGKEICSNFIDTTRCAECLSYLPPPNVTLKHKFISSMPYSLFKICQKLKNLLEYNKYYEYEETDKEIPRNQKIIYTQKQYDYRKTYFIKRLNNLDIIHCSSHRIAQILIDNGILKDKIRIIPLSSKSLDFIIPKPIRDDRYPVVFGFTGGKSLRKGYHLIIKAFSKLDQNKARLIILGAGETGMFKGLSIELRKYYNLNYINQIFQEIDVGVIPSVWEEVFGITGIEMLSARIPVVASRIGGITEWLKNGENGFFIKPNSVDDLYEKMALFVNRPDLISQLQKSIKPWKSFSYHLDEMVNLYKEIISLRREQP